jgi:uncharacterized protein YbaP (TraB family)
MLFTKPTPFRITVSGLESVWKLYDQIEKIPCEIQGRHYDQSKNDLDSGLQLKRAFESLKAYDSGELSLLSSAVDGLIGDQICECKEFKRRFFNEERNERFAETIVNKGKKYPRILVNVGVAHLIGPNNLQDALIKRGFIVSALTFE